MNRFVLSTLLALSLTACASTASPSEAPLEEPATEQSAAEQPASVAALESLLSARHVEDLPSEGTLASHAEPAASLRYIATHHGRMVVRVRALSALRYYDDEATATLLLQTLSDADAHPTLRAAAARGSRALPLDADLREALAAARATRDPRVMGAVDERLGAQPAEPPPAGAQTDEGALRAR